MAPFQSHQSKLIECQMAYNICRYRVKNYGTVTGEKNIMNEVRSLQMISIYSPMLTIFHDVI